MPEMNRRNFLRGAGAALVTGLTTEVHAASRKERRELPDFVREWERRIVDLQDSFVDACPPLSLREVKATLRSLPFLEGQRIPDFALPDLITPTEYSAALTSLYSGHSPINLFELTMERAREEGMYKENTGLSVVTHPNFNQLGMGGAAAFFSPEYKAIFVEDEISQRDILDGFQTHLVHHISDRYVRYEIARAGVNQLDRSSEEFVQFQDELYGRVGEFRDKKTYTELPSDVLSATLGDEKACAELHTEMQEYVNREIRFRTIARMAVPHEGFHYAFDEFIFPRKKEGYKGPAVDNLGLFAFDQMARRFAVRAHTGEASWSAMQQYAVAVTHGSECFVQAERTGVPPTVEGMRGFLDSLHARLAGVDLAAVIRESRDEGLNADQTDAAKLYMNFIHFTNEYLGRIYAGAMGTTQESLADTVNAALQIADVPHTFVEPEHLMVSALTPTEEEVTLLKSMKISGKSII